MTRRLVILDAGFGDAAIERDAAAPFDVIVEDARAATADHITAAACDADGVLVRYVEIDETLMEHCPSWRVIGRYGIGVDNVDVDAASKRGIAVINVPDYCIEEVATHTAALILSTWRKLPLANAAIDEGVWNDWERLRPVRRLSESVLGLVGVGRIGRAVAQLLGPFFGRVVAYDPVAEHVDTIERVALDEVFATADVVSLHCPLTPATRKLADARRLAVMKRGAILVNVSRGGLVDVEALADALKRGRPAAAALDVLPQEPPQPNDPALRTRNLFLTNHVAWYSEASLLKLRSLLACRCAAYLAGKDGVSIVNHSALKGVQP